MSVTDRQARLDGIYRFTYESRDKKIYTDLASLFPLKNGCQSTSLLYRYQTVLSSQSHKDSAK